MMANNENESSDKESERLVRSLSLAPYPHGCGGWFREVMRSDLDVKSEEHKGVRQAFSLIYWMIKTNDISPWHKVKSDETFFYHSGGVLQIHVVDTDKKLYELLLCGSPLHHAGAQLTVTIRRGCYFASQVHPPSGAETDANNYCLLSAVVAPGWCMEDFYVLERSAQGVIEEMEGLCPPGVVERYLQPQTN